ncbi:MAG: hypothetical protein KatS3mg085_437 [Candidatus Dojkabacteria bacterium]|nr:MAG: hypothetical protein KatS3mg085_437 [Candidatus Dojkabacteria bacterium]
MIRHAKILGIEKNFTKDLASLVIEKMKDAYPHLKEKEMFIIDEIDKEEIKFRKTLDNGIKQFYKIVTDIKKSENPHRNFLKGEEAFHLYETYGFPVEMTQELSKEIGFIVDIVGFKTLLEQHKEQSRAGAQKKFTGGLADHSHETTKLHTAHHLLLRALQLVLDENIHQRGSNITSERLRIDFNYSKKITEEEIKKIEDIVNQKITENLPVKRVEMPLRRSTKNWCRNGVWTKISRQSNHLFYR